MKAQIYLTHNCEAHKKELNYEKDQKCCDAEHIVNDLLGILNAHIDELHKCCFSKNYSAIAKVPKRTPTPPPKIEQEIPTKKEFLKYAKTITEVKYKDYEARYGLKYNQWKVNGWRNYRDQPITNWKSTLNHEVQFFQPILKPTKSTEESQKNAEQLTK